MIRCNIAVGDTLTPLGVQLKQLNSSGVWEAVDLTGKTVKFRMVAEDGTVVVDDSTTGVTITDSTNGKVVYDFQSGDVDTAGTYYVWFLVFNGLERDTYPADGKTFSIKIHARS